MYINIAMSVKVLLNLGFTKVVRDPSGLNRSDWNVQERTNITDQPAPMTQKMIQKERFKTKTQT